MLKIEARDKGSNTYKNSVICEYISCKIFSLLNIPTQEVILGRIKDNGVKINYKQYLNSTENKDCLKAILK